MTSTMIGGLGRDVGFSTAPMRQGQDNSFLGVKNNNTSFSGIYADDVSGQDEHSLKV